MQVELCVTCCSPENSYHCFGDEYNPDA
jgi:hypothetical protein